ncbi:FAD-binding oxidoreductase [Alkalicoccus urumqiensis]|uniref:FAD-linked oxidase n=1 Tax=Alkalicoccus urumqiensis TaxID=1548213 RepID=A0A2P6MJG5_ALKUR|nr:FAD-binding oxidoreductase [Alkalicoccus urumqiensis]PRO66432.1 FAD-linked oxidase [Alkalicoccus urumqiensis]
MQTGWIKELEEAFPDMRMLTKETQVQKQSKDYFWYSPVLKEELEGASADCVCFPASTEEVTRLLAFAADRRIPVVPKGGGSGNYGQIVPLYGGILLDMTKMNQILSIDGDIGRFQAGIRLGKLERELRKQDLELRFFPSTLMTSTLGGFIAGGTGGIGSITYGTLWDEGNVLGLTILTMEKTPRVLHIRGGELKAYIHHYGISGIILDVELALAPKTDWVDGWAQFDSFADATGFAEHLARSDIKKRVVSVVEAPVPAVFTGWEERLVPGKAAVLYQTSPGGLEEAAHAAAVHQAVHTGSDASSSIRLSDFVWNHVTLWWLKKHPGDTYIQARFTPHSYRQQIRALQKAFGEEIVFHLEWIRAGGMLVPSSQLIVRYTTTARLYAMMDAMRDIGMRVSSPHTYLLEEGGKDEWVEKICQAKQQNDPDNLLNPGKTKGTQPKEEAACLYSG